MKNNSETNLFLGSTENNNITFSSSFWERDLDFSKLLSDLSHFLTFLANDVFVESLFNDDVLWTLIALKENKIWLFSEIDFDHFG